MCRIRTLILDNNSKIQQDVVIDVKGLKLSVIDSPTFCVYASKNGNGFENFTFKYSNSTELTQTFSSTSNQSLLTIGHISGCVYAYQFKSEIGVNEIDELKRRVLSGNKSARYKNNVRSLLQLLKQVYEIIPHRITMNV